MMKYSFYAQQTVQEVLDSFHISAQAGLSTAQIADNTRLYGRNSISVHDITAIHVFLRQLKTPFFYFLIGAALLSLFLGEWLSSLMLIIFVLINVVMGFYQEYHAERTIALLKKMIIPKVRVVRNQQELIMATDELVPGDIVILSPGDIIPADVRFVVTSDTTVDEAVLTGESVAVVKTHDPAELNDNEIVRATNLGFCGTSLVSGSAVAVVIATGNKTMLGSLAHLSSQAQRDSIFTHEMNIFSKFMMLMMLVTMSLIFMAHVFFKSGSVNIIQLTLFIVALAVTIVPEALPVVISFCLSRGAMRLARNHVVVRRLSAIDDLGSIEVLCADKTGTLTENELEVVDVYGDVARVLTRAVQASAHHENTHQGPRHSFDVALQYALEAHNLPYPSSEKIEYIPFDPQRRCSHSLIIENKSYVLVVRGACETVMQRCGEFGSVTKDAAQAWVRDQGFMGRRVIAVASVMVSHHIDAETMSDANNLQLDGLVAFDDPIKPSTHEALHKAQHLGIAIKILTGDAPEVAGAVAHKLGLIKSVSSVMNGEQLERLDEKARVAAINDCAVFARVTPEQKFSIIKVLQATKKVGFLGEGINDAPALKIAHVGLVVNNASDIAKNAADIILLRKSLRVIIDGIEEGRTVLANTIKYLNVTLASNFSNFYTMAAVSLVIDFLPMLPLQILLVNVLSDFPMIAIATDRVDPIDLKQPQGYQFKNIILRATFFGIVCSLFDIIFFACFMRRSHALVQTMWFMFSILTELVFFYSLRSRSFIAHAPVPSRMMVFCSVISMIIAVAVPQILLGRRVFLFELPSFSDYGMISIIIIAFFVIIECAKMFYFRHSAIGSSSVDSKK